MKLVKAGLSQSNTNCVSKLNRWLENNLGKCLTGTFSLSTSYFCAKDCEIHAKKLTYNMMIILEFSKPAYYTGVWLQIQKSLHNQANKQNWKHPYLIIKSDQKEMCINSKLQKTTRYVSRCCYHCFINTYSTKKLHWFKWKDFKLNMVKQTSKNLCC